MHHLTSYIIIDKFGTVKDIEASIAHASMLGSQRIISVSDSNKIISGIMAKNPTKNLTALNVKGPILSMPVSWAIKVVPQIKVHNKALNNDMDLVIFN